MKLGAAAMRRLAATVADFSIGAFVPTAARLGLPLARFSEIGRWYEGLAALPAWQDAVAARDAATTAWFAKESGNVQLPGGTSRDRQSA